MSTLSQFVGGSPIKSIQRGSTTTTAASNTVTITSVDTAKSVVIATYMNGLASRFDGTWSISASGVLTNSTTLTVHRGNASTGPSDPPTLHWQVIEFI